VYIIIWLYMSFHWGMVDKVTLFNLLQWKLHNLFYLLQMKLGSSWPWWYGSWIHSYLSNQGLSPLMWVRISIRARCTTLCDKVCQWLTTCRWFYPGPPVSSINKTDHHDTIEILLKVVLNTIKPNQSYEVTYIITWLIEVTYIILH
jgi:hypothetical protein